jgi:hypothetical protein
MSFTNPTNDRSLRRAEQEADNDAHVRAVDTAHHLAEEECHIVHHRRLSRLNITRSYCWNDMTA